VFSAAVPSCPIRQHVEESPQSDCQRRILAKKINQLPSCRPDSIGFQKVDADSSVWLELRAGPTSDTIASRNALDSRLHSAITHCRSASSDARNCPVKHSICSAALSTVPTTASAVMVCGEMVGRFDSCDNSRHSMTSAAQRRHSMTTAVVRRRDGNPPPFAGTNSPPPSCLRRADRPLPNRILSYR
jgi:hypothetical protein